MNTQQTNANARTLELRTTARPTAGAIDFRSCETCARRQNILDDETGEVRQLCLASSGGLTWQEMSRMEPRDGGCGEMKLKFMPKR